MHRRYKILIFVILFGVLSLIGLKFYGKRIYRHFFPRPEVPCCVSSPSADCCVKDTLNAEGQRLAMAYLGFDAEQFMRRTDSLLTGLEHVPIKVTCNISSENKTLGTEYNFHFDPGKGHRILRFWLSISAYQSTQELEQDFKTLQQNGKQDMGLTYGNDDIWKTDKKIVWLHLGCAFSAYNHGVIRQMLLDCVKMGTIKGGMKCICGADCD